MTLDSSHPSAPYLPAPPNLGSIWVWELDAPHACELIKVTEVIWNGEEWWVRTERLYEHLANTSFPPQPGSVLNDLSRFREAVTLVRDAEAGN